MAPEPTKKSAWQVLGQLAEGGLVLVVVGAFSAAANAYVTNGLFQLIFRLAIWGQTHVSSRTGDLLAALLPAFVIGFLNFLMARWLWAALSKPAAAGLTVGAALGIVPVLLVIYAICC
jgi:hypothetical protein